MIGYKSDGSAVEIDEESCYYHIDVDGAGYTVSDEYGICSYCEQKYEKEEKMNKPEPSKLKIIKDLDISGVGPVVLFLIFVFIYLIW